MLVTSPAFNEVSRDRLLRKERAWLPRGLPIAYPVDAEVQASVVEFAVIQDFFQGPLSSFGDLLLEILRSRMKIR